MLASTEQKERSATWLCLAVLVVLALALHHEVLFGGAIYHMDDAADGYYPCHVAIARAYGEGSLPAWERGAGAGWPMVADPYYGAFYPLGVLFSIFGAARGLGVQIAVHTILCGAGMMLLLRRRGLSPAVAAFGAVSLALSSFLVCRVRHIIFPEGLAWLTFALAGAEGYVQTRARKELILVAAAIGMTFVCGALPLLPFFGIFAAAYVGPRLRLAPRPLVAGAALAGASLVGLCLSAAQLVPTLSHLPYSPRALGTSYAFASSYAWPSLGYLATLVAPDVYGGELRGRWFGAFNHWEMAAYYVGLWAVLLSPLALLRRRARPGYAVELVALAVTALLGIALAFGDAAPVHGWFYRHVPLYAALRCPTRALVMTMLAFSILGAEGLAGIVERLRGRSSLWLVLGGATLSGGVAIAYALMKTRAWHHTPGAIPPGIVETRLAFAHLAVVLGAGLAALCVGLSGRGRLVAPLFLAVACGDLFVLNRGYVQPQPADYAPGTDRFQAVEWLIAQHPKERFASDAHGPFRLHNVGMTYGLESAGAYSSVQIFRYVNFLEVLGTGKGLPTPLRVDPAATDVRRFDSPLTDLLNVRWVISDHLPAPGYVERFHPLQDHKGPASRHEPIWDRRLSVWENPHVLPRAFVVYGAEVVRDGDAQIEALNKLDPRRSALLEEQPSPAVAPPSSATPALTPAQIVEASRTRMVVDAEVGSPAGVLVVSEAHYPGWSVTVDGAPAPLMRADYALRGVPLAPGHHRVVFSYASAPLRTGLLVSFFGLLVLAALGLVRRR